MHPRHVSWDLDGKTKTIETSAGRVELLGIDPCLPDSGSAILHSLCKSVWIFQVGGMGHHCREYSHQNVQGTLNRLESRWFIFLSVFPDGKVQITKKLSYLYFEAAQSDG